MFVVMIEANQTIRNQNQRTVRPQEMLPSQELQEDQVLQQAEMQTLRAKVKVCPYCGAENEEESIFCAQCGQPIGKLTCPYCGAEMDPGADFCETCHRYVRKDVCSYCGYALHGNEAYCPECGSPRGGLVCPTCHTMNDFAFCKKCGTPLTAEAKEMVKRLQKEPDYIHLQEIVKEYNLLESILPACTEKDRLRDKKNDELRKRVLTLLAKDSGMPEEDIVIPSRNRMTDKQLEQLKQQNMEALAEALEKLATRPTESPIMARNYTMACKPQGIRLAWVCNYKHAMHSSPCGCAKPQLGGKWVVLGKNSSSDIKDDKK